MTTLDPIWKKKDYILIENNKYVYETVLNLRVLLKDKFYALLIKMYVFCVYPIDFLLKALRKRHYKTKRFQACISERNPPDCSTLKTLAPHAENPLIRERLLSFFTRF